MQIRKLTMAEREMSVYLNEDFHAYKPIKALQRIQATDFELIEVLGDNNDEIVAHSNTYENKIQTLKEIYGRIRELRTQITKQREEQQKKNLAVKQEIIQKLASLTEQPESMNKTFSDFRALQEEWKEEYIYL